jgi:dTDP-4-amino-4,6-dideoxygalactose transaminase
VPANCVHGYKDLAVKFRKSEQRAAAEAALAAAGVMTKRYFFPVHRMEAYQSYTHRLLPVTDHLRERLLCIPLYHDLPDEQIDAIAEMIRESLGLAPAEHFAA